MGQSKQHDKLMQTDILSNKKQLQMINLLIKNQTYMFPRLHLSTQLLIKELCRDSKQLSKNFSVFFKTVLEDNIFNKEIQNNIKSVVKMKFIHIGFKIVEAILQEVSKSHDAKLKAVVIRSLLLKFTGFKNTLVKNLHLPKNQLHEVSIQVKKQIVQILEQLKDSKDSETSDLFFELLTSIFGPNIFSHFSPKKNSDLMTPLCSHLDDSQITKYIEHLQQVIEKPDLNTFYPLTEQEDKEIELALKQTASQKTSQIKLYGLKQLSLILVLFKDTVTTTHIMISLNILTMQGFLPGQEAEVQASAQFKMFSLVGNLHRFSVSGEK